MVVDTRLPNARYPGNQRLTLLSTAVPNIIVQSKAFQANELPSSNETPTEWFALVEKSLTHPDEHVVKAIRSLAQYSQLYGSTRLNSKDFDGVDLKGVEYLDGNFFRRIAVLTLKRCFEGNHGDGSFGYTPGSHWYWDREAEEL